jgi:uncharacterized protein (DUF433 family)
MAIAFDAEPAPLRQDEQGDIRVGAGRVLLHLVVHAFEDGAMPETIVQMYPSLTLADTYGAITYYLRHRENVVFYLHQREQRAAKIPQTIEARQEDMSDIRERLLRQREETGTGSVTTPD